MRGKWFWLFFIFVRFDLTYSKVFPSPNYKVTSKFGTVSPISLSNVTLTQSIIAGGFSRVVAQTILHPLDTMRTHTQLRVKDPHLGIFPSNLFKGIVPQIIFSGPAGALQFSVLEKSRKYFSRLGVPWTLTNLLSASLGAVTATIIRIPQEEIKIACQSSSKYSQAIKTLNSLFQSRGFFGLYRNAPIVILRDVLWHTISYTLLQQVKSSYQIQRKDQLSQSEEFLLGGIVGTVACLITHPLDVIRTIQMTSPEKQSISLLFRELSRQGGALSSGLLYRIAYLAPMSAITYSLYESILLYFAKKQQRVL